MRIAHPLDPLSGANATLPAIKRKGFPSPFNENLVPVADRIIFQVKKLSNLRSSQGRDLHDGGAHSAQAQGGRRWKGNLDQSCQIQNLFDLKRQQYIRILKNLEHIQKRYFFVVVYILFFAFNIHAKPWVCTIKYWSLSHWAIS